jgi:3-dehydroquinate synthase
MIKNSESIVIASAQGDYQVTFYKNLIELNKVVEKNRDVYFLVDKAVWEIYGKDLDCVDVKKLLILNGDENTKSLIGITQVIEWLNKNGATKSSILIGIGGGVIQDVTTFVSHVYYRGIKWEFIPTTLLSQSDSCIGAKCGINVLENKNQVGVLHSPSAVYIVEEFLKTLEKEEFESGFGEIFKLAVTGPNQFWEELKVHLSLHKLDSSKVLTITAKSLLAKKAIIEIDEYERDLRRILNYGHSFGHSLETITKNRVSHGYAILFGMDLINYLGVLWGVTDRKFAEEFRELIQDNFPEFKLEKINVRDLVNGLKKDKKAVSGKMNFAVVKDIGEIVIVNREIDESLENDVENYLSDVCKFYSA